MEKFDTILHPAFQRFERSEPYAVLYRNLVGLSENNFSVSQHFKIQQKEVWKPSVLKCSTNKLFYQTVKHEILCFVKVMI